MPNNKKNNNYNNNIYKSTRLSGAIQWRLVLNVLLLTVLIQHVTHVAHAAQKSSNSKSLLLVKRDLVIGLSDTNEEEPTVEDYNNDKTELHEQDTVGGYVTTSSSRLGNFNIANNQIDLGAYGNEFNMQDEAIIPEDILDQEHMQDVDVMDDTSASNFHASVDQYAADYSLETTSTNNRNFSTDKKPSQSTEKTIKENTTDKVFNQTAEETGKLVGNVEKSFRSIGPVTFHARSISRKKISEIDEWHNNDKDVEKQQQQQQHLATNAKGKLNKMRKYNNKPLAEQYADNNYKKENKHIPFNSGNTMKLDKTAIEDIQGDSSNEDESFYYKMKNSNNKINGNTNIGRIEHVEKQLARGRSLIDSDKSVSDVSRVKTLAKDVNFSAQTFEVNAVKVHQGKQTILPFSPATTIKKANRMSDIEMKSVDVNRRSKKQRRHLPEINFGHQSKDFDLNDNNDDLISVASYVNDNGEKSSMVGKISKSSLSEFPIDINDNSRRDYFGIWKIGTNTTGTAKVRLPSENEGKQFDGTLIDEDLKTDEALRMKNREKDMVVRNPLAIVSGTTFEHHKAQQRYNRRNGHKTHKKKYKDYLRHAWAVTTTNPKVTETTERAIISDKIDIAIDNNNGNATTTNKYNKTTIDNAWKENRQRQRAQKLRAETSRGFPIPPIFLIASAAPSTANRKESLTIVHSLANTTTATALQSKNKMKILDKPFYEGQINYYLETKDGDNDDVGEGYIDVNENDSKIGNKIFDSPESSSNWYSHVGPMLRNGLRTVSQNQDTEKDVTAIYHIYKNRHDQQQRQANHMQQRNRQNHVKQQLQEQQQQKHHHHHHNHKQMKGAQQHLDHVHHFSHAFHHRHHQKHHNKLQLQQQQMQLQKQSMSKDVKNGHHERADYMTSENSYTQTPYPPINHKNPGMAPTIGHQITELREFERYYAKWPHLARVQFQVYDEHMREAHEQEQQQQEQQQQQKQQQQEQEQQQEQQHKQQQHEQHEQQEQKQKEEQQQNQEKTENEEYPEYEYESLAELEEAQKENAEDANLPPYIRKYNRRNKQLLNLLEGPLPPPQGYHWSGSKLQPGPLESSSDASVVRLDDEYMLEKRKRYHQLHNTDKNNNNNNNHDIFAKQRTSNESMSEINLQPSLKVLQNATTAKLNQLAGSNNRLPDEDVNVSTEDMKHDNWKKEIESEIKSKWHTVNEIIGNVAQINNLQMDKISTPTPSTVTLSSSSSSIQTPKSLVFRLPTLSKNYDDGYSMRQRSRSANVASNPGQRRHVSGFLDSMELHGYSGEREIPISSQQNNNRYLDASTAAPTTVVTFQYPPTPQPTPKRSKMPTVPPRSISAFVYHRVVDDSAPKIVGTGSGVQGRKQQLPFVAITDRRLETFKKSLLERQKEFEQNNFPPFP